jgi:hypothetical protein
MVKYSSKVLWDQVGTPVVEQAKFRLLPVPVIRTAITHLQETGDVGKVMQYVLSAFEIYRASVCTLMGAVHYNCSGVLEWPELVSGWENLDSVIAGGDHVKGNDLPTVSRDVGSGLEEVTVIGSEAQAFVRERQPWEEQIEYKISSLDDVRFIFMQSWQILSLVSYVNPINALFANQRIGRMSIEDVRGYFGCLMIDSKTPRDVPAARIGSVDEKGGSLDFFFRP